MNNLVMTNVDAELLKNNGYQTTESMLVLIENLQLEDPDGVENNFCNYMKNIVGVSEDTANGLWIYVNSDTVVTR
jgi:hypothetical protein